MKICHFKLCKIKMDPTPSAALQFSFSL